LARLDSEDREPGLSNLSGTNDKGALAVSRAAR
jgi:hypothetical protein